MNIYINNTAQEIRSDARITDALYSLNITSQKGIAIAINNNVVPRTEWESYALNPDDKMILIKATQGG